MVLQQMAEVPRAFEAARRRLPCKSHTARVRSKSSAPLRLRLSFLRAPRRRIRDTAQAAKVAAKAVAKKRRSTASRP